MIPYSEDAEAQVLGAAMMNRAWRDEILGVLTADDFHVPAHAAMFRAIIRAHADGQPADVGTVSLLCDGQVRREQILAVHASSPIGLGIPLGVVADLAARRRLIVVADQIRAQAVDRDVDVTDTLADMTRAVETVRLADDTFIPARDVSHLLDGPDEYDWLVPQLLEVGDRVIWVAPEGGGKSELQLQLAVMLASGIHPFARYPIRRLKVLIVDLENSERQLRRRLRRLIDAAGDSYRGGLMITEPRAAGIDLRNPRDFRWLDRHCEQVAPDVLIIGPLYKAFRVHRGEKKTDETAAEEAAFALDRLRERHSCAVSIEAHAPHGSGGDREGLRPYGASLWLRWPEFGWGMKPIPGERAVELVPWRGARDRDREWPSKLHVGNYWPWEAE